MRGSRNASDLDAVGATVRKQVVHVDFVGPTEKVRLGLVRSRTENGESRRRLGRGVTLLALEVGEPFLKRGTLCVALAHRCHTLGEGR
jgi:hypothetical protein